MPANALPETPLWALPLCPVLLAGLLIARIADAVLAPLEHIVALWLARLLLHLSPDSPLARFCLWWLEWLNPRSPSGTPRFDLPRRPLA